MINTQPKYLNEPTDEISHDITHATTIKVTTNSWLNSGTNLTTNHNVKREKHAFNLRIPLNFSLVKESIEAHISCSKDGQTAEIKMLNKVLAIVEKKLAAVKN